MQIFNFFFVFFLLLLGNVSFSPGKEFTGIWIFKLLGRMWEDYTANSQKLGFGFLFTKNK